MSRGFPARQVLHSALEQAPGDPLSEVRLGDRQRLAIILQAAALLSHLATASWRLTSPWLELQVDAWGVLRGARAEPGRSPSAVQLQLAELSLGLFRSRERVAGRGQARRIVRQLLQRWQRYPWPVSPDRPVKQILEAAPFLWSRTFSASRRALTAELVEGGRRRLVVAGCGCCELRILAGTLERSVVESRLMRSPSPCRLSRIGSAGSSAADHALQAARWHFARGRFERAVDLLDGLHTFEARALFAECSRQLGDLAAARRQIDDLERRRMSPDQFLRLAEVAAALCGEMGARDARVSWAVEALETADSESRPRAELLAAEVAHRCRDGKKTMQHLAAATAVADDPQLLWRWHRLRARVFSERGETAAACDSMKAAIRGSRRALPPFEAARLWHRLAQLRLELGELAAAERAAGHAVRLFDGVDDAKGQMRALRRLLEIRLRRGTALDVDTVLRSGSAGPPDAVLTALWARWELLRGHPAEALRRVRRYRDTTRREGTPPEDAVLSLLECRSLGWLGRAAEAGEGLRAMPDSAWKGLEREELPALWALGDDWQRAKEVAREHGVEELWSGFLERKIVGGEAASALAELSAYRSARVVLDMELLVPEALPEIWRERASRQFLRLGAESFARRLERHRSGPWLALAGQLKSKPVNRIDIASLFSNAGYFDVNLSFQEDSEKSVLVPGRAGNFELVADVHPGRLVLRARTSDPALEAIFALAVREFRPAYSTSSESSRISGILGRSDSLQRALQRLERLAATDMAVLIQGETGTGKELAARQLHVLGPRGSQAFVAINCAALSESLLLSDLFGHVRGAFTGADRDRAGLFETASGGTVFLDEIGDLPHAAQGKLLRVLQEREVRRLGESLPRPVDVRVVAATHRDLESMVAENRFRRDLYYRLRVGRVDLPPLRRRGRDVLLLADHFLEAVGYRLTHRARQHLLHYPWPGNVRELRNVLQVAAALSEGNVVDVEHLELPRAAESSRLGYHQRVEEFRRRLVKEALAASDGNRAEAARRLDLSRQALSYLVRKLQLA